MLPRSLERASTANPGSGDVPRFQGLQPEETLVVSANAQSAPNNTAMGILCEWMEGRKKPNL